MNKHLKLIVSHHKREDVPGSEEDHTTQIMNKGAEALIHFTNSVEWVPSEIRWAFRWGDYLNMANVQIHRLRL